jgi:hypothetical protein
VSKRVWVLLESNGYPVSYNGHVMAFRTRKRAVTERLQCGMQREWGLICIVPAPRKRKGKVKR